MKNNIYKAVQVFFILISVILLSSCSNNTVYESYNKFENLNWKRFNIQKFEFKVENIEIEYDVYLTIRHIPEIPYKEFKINYTFYTPSGDMRSNDIILDLYDNDKNKLSECLGDFCDFTFPIREGLTFSDAGTVKFEIENKYPKVDMPGIMEVGLIVKKAK